MKQSRQRRGVTLIEITIGLIIISAIFAVVFNIFGVGLRGSHKGMAHLTIMEGAAILLSQIEYDLLRAYVLTDPAEGSSDKAARWEIFTEDSSGKGIVMYNLLDEDGIERTLEVGGNVNKHVYCRGLKVGLKFHHISLPDTASSLKRVGMWVELSVASPEKFATVEKFSMKRLIICKSIQPPL